MAIEGLQRSDAELLAAVRTGDADAFGVLYDRHAVAAAKVARRYTNSEADAEDVLADAFTAVYNTLLRGKGPTEAFRAYLFTTVRRVATVHRERGHRLRPTDDVATLEANAVPMAGADAPALAGFESTVVARAFDTLPERWQLVLWHTEVEGLAPAQVAPLLGLSANSASALAYRAREGLRQAYLTQHLADGLDDRCRPVADSLGAYVRGGLGPRESRKVAAHLDECPRCTVLYAELGDVNHGMRAIVAPLVLGVAGMGVLDQLLPIGGGLAALGGLSGLTNGGAGAAASSAAASGAAGSGAGSSGAGSGAAAGASSSQVPVAGVVAAAVVALVVAVTVAVYALSGKPTPSADEAPAPAASASASSAQDRDEDPDPTPTVSDEPLEAMLDQVGDDPTSDPSHQNLVGPAPTAVTGPQPAPQPSPVVAVDTAGSVLALRAGESNQELRLAVHNSGDTVAGLVAAVTLPDGVTLVGAPGVDGGGRSAPSPSWNCLPTSAQSATCTLARLAAGATSVISLRVSVAESYDGTGGSLEVRFSGGGVHLAPITVPVTVASAPARVVVAADRTPVALVTGRSRTLSLDVTNAGGSTGRASVVLQVPRGVQLAGPSPKGWTCLHSDRTTIDCTASLGPRSHLALEVPLSARAVTPRTGLITVFYSPASGGGVLPVPYTVVRPATLVVDAPASVGPLALDVAADLSLKVTNTGGLDSAPVTLDLTLPHAVVLGGPVRGNGWTCAGTRCTHDGLASGASTRLTLPLKGPSGTPGEVVVTPSAADADARPARVQVQVTAPTPATTVPRVSFTGNVRVAQAGAPLLSCSSVDPACAGYLASATNNNGLEMVPLDDAPPPTGSRPAVAVSSSTELDFPHGQPVQWAGLYWSANAGPDDGWSTNLTSARLSGPDGVYQPVSGTVVANVTDGAGRRYYQSFADVTAQVQAGKDGTWSLADAAVAATATDPDPTYYAGWALVVVYGNTHAGTDRTVSVYDSGLWVSSATAQTVLTVPTGVGRQVTVGAVAWEGDAATTGDRLLLDGVALTPVGGLASSNNAFDSTATGWRHVNSLGVDVKAFAPVVATSSVGTLTASTSSDQYLLGALTVTVDH